MKKHAEKGRVKTPILRESIIQIKKVPKLKNPLLIVGLPGIGLVSKLAVEHLIRETKAEKFATIFSPYFPNEVISLGKGWLKPFTISLFYKKTKKGHFVFVVGDIQPLTVEGQYELSSKILAFFYDLGGKEVLSMAGYGTNKIIEKPKIFASSTNKKLTESFLKKGAALLKKPIPIIGMAGMVPALSSIYGMKGACLLVETPGSFVDPRGAKALVEFISKIEGIKVKTTNLDKQAKETDRILHELEKKAREEAAKMSTLQRPAKETLSYIR